MIPIQSGSTDGLGIAVEITIAIVVVVTIVGALIWLAKKGYFEPGANEDASEERDELGDAAGKEEFRIPYRRRVSAWSGPMKVFVGSLLLLGVGVGFATYQVMKTGSPVHQFVTREIRYGIVAVIGIVGGVRLKSWFDSQVGKLTVIYERAGQENLVERIPYAKTKVRRRDGVTTVPEVAESRLFDLFWRYRQRGEDRRLRGDEKPLDDVITHLIPDHGEELPDGGGYMITTRKEGDQILTGDALADVTYASPNSLSDERATQIREEKKRKEAELQGVKATNAELYQQVTKMRKRIKNDEYRDRQELIEDFDKFSSFFRSFSGSVQRQLGNGDGTEKKNGEATEAEA